MRRAALAPALAALACAAGACAYFNAMYNAEHYARAAQTSERAGRLTEAHANWVEAAAHADTLIVHHPASGWVAKAQLLRGKALMHLGDYSGAEVALQSALRRRLPREDRLEALGLLGRAQVYYHQLDSAGVALDSAALARDRAVRAEALLDRGRVWLALGRPDSARLAFRRSSGAEAAFALAAVDVRLGDTAAAGAVYDSLAGAKTFDEGVWRPALDSLAQAGDSAHVARLVGRLVVRSDCSAGAAARLLLDEADRRIGVGDSTAAAAAWRQVRDVARDSVEGQAAGVALARLAIAAAAADSDLDRPHRQLEELARAGGNAGREAGATLAQLVRADALASATDAPDAHWFQRAELLRDSLGAGRLAAADFAAMAERFPTSPWTPKALVAAIAEGASDADSLQGLLLHRYARSPYVIAASGGVAGAAALADLEDSLRTVLAVASAGAAAGSPARGESVEESEPGVRSRRLGEAAVAETRAAGAGPARAGAAAMLGPPSRPPWGPPGPEPPE